MADKGTVDRPDLEEFLSALSGFVDKKDASPDSNYLKFLDIFCRSVGSSEGHLLRPGEAGRLASVSSFGVDAKFEGDFNASRDDSASPIDDAFTTHRVVAVVEIVAPDVPAWFFKLTERFGYKALVAVPIIGPQGPTGVLCAYYRDVCLFDQGTLERLASIGRMLGGAEGSSDRPAPRSGTTPAVPPPAPAPAPAAGPEDDFALTLTAHAFTKIQVFAQLVVTVGQAFPEASVICGPVRVVSGETMITVADGSGVPTSMVSHRFALPDGIRKNLGGAATGPVVLSTAQQGALKDLIKSPSAAVISRPLMWQGKMQAAVIAWRSGGTPLSSADEQRLGRFAAIAALALNAA